MANSLTVRQALPDGQQSSSRASAVLLCQGVVRRHHRPPKPFAFEKPCVLGKRPRTLTLARNFSLRFALSSSLSAKASSVWMLLAAASDPVALKFHSSAAPLAVPTMTRCERQWKQVISSVISCTQVALTSSPPSAPLLADRMSKRAAALAPLENARAVSHDQS
uniref:Uncharacterized protein n=1 Tax=Haptolina brevifila TaxID=156173 RepID=A0A7S2MW66_9EUKA